MKNKIDEIIDRFKSPLDGETSVYSMADYIFELERKLQNTSSNSDYAKCLACAEDIASDYDINIKPELIAKTIERRFA